MCHALALHSYVTRKSFWAFSYPGWRKESAKAEGTGYADGNVEDDLERNSEARGLCS